MLDEPSRDALLDSLGRHYASGHLDADELDERIAGLLAAATHVEAAATLDGLAPLPAAGRARPAARSWFRGRHGEAEQPRPGWLPTDERFRDPASGRLVRVWLDPGDRSRHYVPEPR